jgi:hypothetical protein
MIAFYEQRTGYVEIVRNERLERLYFHLPDACLPGGPLEKDESVHTALYRADRHDFDKKNMQFIENMCAIVEKELYRQKIRQTKYSFTVTKWVLIRTINFQWTMAMHVIMILGGYFPSQGVWKSSPEQLYQEKLEEYYLAESLAGVNGTRRKGGGGGSAGDDAGSASEPFPLTSADVYTYEKIQPSIVWILRVMSWINLITCGLRFFSFVRAELPIIVRRWIHAHELETEDQFSHTKKALGSNSVPLDAEADENTIVFVTEHVPRIDAAAAALAAMENNATIDQSQVKAKKRRYATKSLLLLYFFCYHVSFATMSLLLLCFFCYHVSFATMSLLLLCLFCYYVSFATMFLLLPCLFCYYVSFATMSLLLLCFFCYYVSFATVFLLLVLLGLFGI